MAEALSPRTGYFWPKTIRGLATVVACASAFVTALLGGATYAIVHEELERQIDQRVDAETRTLLKYYREHGFEGLRHVIRLRDDDQPAIGYLAKLDRDVGRTMGYMLVDRAGRRQADTLHAVMPPLGWSQFLTFRRGDGSTGIAQAMNTALPGGGQLVVAADREIIDHMDATLLRLFVSAFGLLLVTGVLVIFGFGRVVQRRLRAFEGSARAIIAGDIDQRVAVDGSGGEFDQLAHVLNQMLDRISLLVASLRDVSTALAHDLRTPLSRVRAQLEQAEALATEPPQRALLDNIIAETDDLLALFASLLAIAELDSQNIRRRFVRLDLGDAVAEIAEAHRPTIEDAGLSLEVHTISAPIRGDRALLQRLVGNLLDNALVHTPPGTHICVRVECQMRQVILRVADNGPGISTEHHARVFERLARLDSARSRPGHGLGLSMVAAIAAAHSGDIEIRPGQPGFALKVHFSLATG
ncbi:HAMP domain-containing protein [Sphingomonas sp. AP4-R1]|uniref:sensor histidine kinase n=1 Tax=Sphingomonas sp. AP4-R1 TaxID=2735134 RepID=UPI0014935589|nr:ATP-binding protein [Sphingomonas sp. AP4-R1]QJU59948.1 HAMP domain-containing protein [Sphingomonas sp. AP4-R1]